MRTSIKLLIVSLCIGLGGVLFVGLGPATNAGAATGRDPLPVSAALDREVEKRLAAEKVTASPLADDAEFLRRVTVDIIGRVPTAERVVAFLEDKSPDKRRAAIDELLAMPAYGDHFGTTWYRLLIVLDDNNRRLVAKNFEDWLEDRFNKNVPWSKIVSDILTAEGDRDKNPAVNFFLAHVGDTYQPEPEKLTGAAASAFLGMQLQCAECHNHPFTKWKQTDFWGVAAFFSHTRSEGASKKEQKAGDTPAVHESATEPRRKKKDAGPAKPAPAGSIVIPESKGKVVKAKFLEGGEPSLAGKTAYRPALAAWVTSPSNRMFSDAMVNRTWSHFFGKGLTNPIDDMRADNPPSHPEVLSIVSKEFAASGFDVKHLIRVICNSRTYQRSSVRLPDNKEDEALYSRMAVKMMTADVLFDSFMTVMGDSPLERRGAKRALPIAKKGVGNDPRSRFIEFFDTIDEKGPSPEYSHGIPQVLRLMNADVFNRGGAVIDKFAKVGAAKEKVIEGLFLSTLSRRPTEAEAKKFGAFAGDSPDRGKYSQVLWVLLNSSEFILNH